MNKQSYLLTNIGQLNGILDADKRCLKGAEMNNITTISNAYLYVENGIIASFGSMDNCPKHDVDILDQNGMWILPGLIDSHTHMVFAGPRQNEYVMRLEGKTYADIASEGGGILNSARKLQIMDEEELFQNAFKYANQAIAHGTTVLEIKSGYGLETKAELKMLRIIKRLKNELPIMVKSTFLGAHAFPLEYKQDHEGYISKIINEMLPAIAENNLADFIDVFCDTGFYSPEETESILHAAAQYGLRAKIHGNELGLSGGVQVAVKHNALSVDHLEHISQVEIECLLAGNTMPVALPGSSFFLKIPYTPARQMIDAGLPVAVASDFNPGSSPHYNLWFTWSLACLYNGMWPAEVFNALTINAAYALGIESSHGSITVGKKANLIASKAFENINEIPYWFAQNHAQKVFVSK